MMGMLMTIIVFTILLMSNTITVNSKDCRRIIPRVLDFAVCFNKYQ